MSKLIKDLGAVSAYAYAVEKGYTGTEDEFAELMYDYTDVAQTAVEAKDEAVSASASAQTSATTANTKYVRIGAVTIAINELQLEKGSEATTYAPYKEPIELCKIGDYQDRIYKDGDTWYIEKQIGKTIIDETTNIGYDTGGGRFFTSISGALRQNSRILIYSNYYHYISSGAENGGGFIYDGVFYMYNQAYTNTTDYKNWLETHNTEIYYILATPEVTEIADIELIGQLEALKQARSYDTTTNISQNTANKPFILNATAVQKGTDTATVDNEGNIYAKPTIDIEGSGAVEVYLNNNQIFSIDLSNNNECIIDTTNLEAYDPDTSQLMNRQVTGDYSNFVLNTGENQVKVSGNVTKATISNYTRWL